MSETWEAVIGGTIGLVVGSVLLVIVLLLIDWRRR
jgi:hypothetical protein